MERFDEFIEHMDMLFKYALKKTRNFEDAEDLVHDTYLIALRKIQEDEEIKSPKAFLFGVFQKKYGDYVGAIKKDRTIGDSIVNEYSIMIEETNAETEETLNLQQSETVRRELAHLSKTYREVMVMFYMKNKKVKDISNILGIPEGTIKYRLDIGRKQMKEGIVKMETYTNTSYEPEYLTILFGGRAGKNGEPLNVITNLIDHNVLILAYDTPLSPVEISKKMGISTAYIEESVEKLLKHELLRKSGSRVYTDFFIASETDIARQQNIAISVVEDIFKDSYQVVDELVYEYEKQGTFSELCIIRRYIYATFSLFFRARHYLVEKLNLLTFENYPDRADEGKWIIDVGFKSKQKEMDQGNLYVHGPWINQFFDGLYTEEWDTAIGKTYRATYSLDISNKERYHILYDILKNNEIDPNYSALIKDFIRLGFIEVSSQKNKKWDSCIPILSRKNYNTLIKLNTKFGNILVDKIGNYLIEVVKENKSKHPKWIASNQPYINLNCLSMVPLRYVFKVSEAGTISIEEDKNYPVTLLIEK